MTTHRPHRRHNPLTDSWVLVSPHRTQRPWQGQLEDTAAPAGAAYDSECYLCPGNERAGGNRNPDYDGVFIFDNDFPALLPERGTDAEPSDGLFRTMPEAGRCRVICYSPEHNRSLGTLPIDRVCDVVDHWAAEYEALIGDHQWVQIFENRGAAMGCSNPHPHGQIWAAEHLPTEAERERTAQADYRKRHESNLLSDYARDELRRGERVLIDNESWLVVVPYWAAWPFETLLISKKPAAHLGELDKAQKQDLALAIKELLHCYDNLFSVAFPFTFGWHSAPRGSAGDDWRLHAHFYPPLLRSATVRKFMVGYEMLSEPQRDITPEQACQQLRNALQQRRA